MSSHIYIGSLLFPGEGNLPCCTPRETRGQYGHTFLRFLGQEGQVVPVDTSTEKCIEIIWFEGTDGQDLVSLARSISEAVTQLPLTSLAASSQLLVEEVTRWTLDQEPYRGKRTGEEDCICCLVQ